ncbi:hypothetical protein HMPREF7215_1789 [Pyramidobacter piscolens W5455]|uniref:Uncharacterized protein n=1 Tax=Pyramidobacter piscolens W5455 TaxID=352165 RepID=A0ABP2HUK3_9BACT|nr:hypothetical protein HMPREF7215_1789 [Pyramidobacter piscolens W5455]
MLQSAAAPAPGEQGKRGACRGSPFSVALKILRSRSLHQKRNKFL